MSKQVTIFGGSGFVGRYVTRRLAKDGWRIRIAVRRPNEAIFLKPYGHVGQVEPVFCNIRDEGSVRTVLTGSDAVVNCVGILQARGANSFDAVQAEGAGRVARLAAEAGAARFVHLSAIGADPQSDSDYGRTKAEGEAAVLAAFPQAVILRPSIIFGSEDQFFNRFAQMARRGRFLPLVHGDTKFQPVYVDDVALAVVAGLNGAPAGIYELGGPETEDFRGLMRHMMTVIMRDRRLVNVPVSLAGLMAGFLDGVEKASGGLISNSTLTRDQLKMLAHDNVVSPNARGFADLGIRPQSFEAVIPEYLWPFRPNGQYARMRQAGKNLKA